MSLAALTMPGCVGALNAGCDGERARLADLGDFAAPPSPRMGSLPFPGPVSLYEDADPAGLGSHVYRAGTPFEGVSEVSRGIVYSCRAGFLDLAHIRNTIDNAAHIHARLRWAIDNGHGCVRYRLAEPSVWRIEVVYPPGWASMEPARRAAIGREAAVRGAEALAFRSMSWHELLTWYGYRSTGVVSEKPSAFTYEDTVSHAVGALVAGRVLREVAADTAALPSAAAFGASVDRELARAMEECGAGPTETTREAIRLVEGEWWSGLSVQRRFIERHDEPLTPWLVEGTGPCGATAPLSFRVAGLDATGPNDLGFRAWIDPRVSEEGAILDDLAAARGADRPTREIAYAEDVPVLLEGVRAEVEGEAADAE